MKRRSFVELAALGSTAFVAGCAQTQTQAQPQAAAGTCATDGTPNQFIPKKAADATPLVNELTKYPRCPYCNMDRTQFHASRMLIQYGDDLVDGTCSIHCAALSLGLNIDRQPKTMWVGDNAAAGDVKPLVEVDKATFLVGSKIKGVMTQRSKVAYGDKAAAEASRKANGGELVDFDQALAAAYADMSRDVSMIRKNREERRKRAAEQAKKS
ncbi:MAG: nitrous oxide reductase accessory protein NosL [Pseudomonadota bacterium]|nr:nitrous oxide reductase accessory protein NosL [Pseudomonadota bacterium]